MIVNFSVTQAELVRKAADLYEKRAEAAAKLLEELGVDGMGLEAARGRVSTVANKLADDHAPNLTSNQRDAIKRALIVMRGKVVKVMEGELALGIPVEASQDRQGEIAEIYRMLDDQLDIENADTTISFNGGPEIPFNKFEDAVDAIAR